MLVWANEPLDILIFFRETNLLKMSIDHIYNLNSIDDVKI